MQDLIVAGKSRFTDLYWRNIQLQIHLDRVKNKTITLRLMYFRSKDNIGRAYNNLKALLNCDEKYRVGGLEIENERNVRH